MNPSAVAVAESMDEGPRMSFGEHLEELRTRLIRSIVALTAGIAVTLAFYGTLVDVMVEPYEQAMDRLGIPAHKREFIATHPAKPAVAAVKLALIVAFFLASPYVGRQIWGFVSAGLYPHERSGARAFAFFSMLLFVAGCAFGYHVLVPYALYGLALFLDPTVVTPKYDFGEYLGLVMNMTIILGAVFQLPLVMAFLSRAGLVDPVLYGRYRRHAILGSFVLAALLSPPELISLFVFVVPLLVLYEAGIVASRLMVRRTR